MKNFERFLEFDGKRISIMLTDGTWWVAVKPICEVLNIEYTRTFKNIKEDEILGQLLAIQPIVAADGRLREMACLPEKYVYGWLFSIRSDSQELRNYKRKCYELLYNHFHGAITGRITTLKKKADVESEMADIKDRIDTELSISENYLRMQDLKKYNRQLKKSLQEQDSDLINGQLAISLS